MRRVLITGMSGAGKSSALLGLRRLGHRAVDTDTDDWSHWVRLPDGGMDWVWRADEITALLRDHHEGTLFVAGCKSNQGEFYSWFDHVVLLSAPAEILLSRVARRTNNTYGKSPYQREQILRHLDEVEPLLRDSATVEIDASLPLHDVVWQLDRLVAPGARVRAQR